MEPVPVAEAVKQPTHDHLRPRVAALDRLHDTTTLCRRARVHRLSHRPPIRSDGTITPWPQRHTHGFSVRTIIALSTTMPRPVPLSACIGLVAVRSDDPPLEWSLPGGLVTATGSNGCPELSFHSVLMEKTDYELTSEKEDSADGHHHDRRGSGSG